jgi:hypothetical protein
VPAEDLRGEPRYGEILYARLGERDEGDGPAYEREIR